MIDRTAELLADLGHFSADPLGFVYWAFPWGVPGTELEDATGPEPWQRDILLALEKGLLTPSEAILLARTSGHGIGKSACVAWIILWAFSTFEDTKGVVTANTENQLKTKTWVELATWFRRFIAKELFQLTATSLRSRDPSRWETWRIDMVPWSEKNTEAFAGLHNKNKRILLVMDEASAIPDGIWEVAEGALTDQNTQIIWAVFGNPTRNKGRFRACFKGGQFAHRWRSARIDSRSVSFTNKAQIAAWIEDYGEDSDFIRVRVKGEFPRVDAESFITRLIAEEAVLRFVGPQGGQPLILGADIGRFGDDPSVIYPRRGRDASSIQPELRFGQDTMETAAWIAEAMGRLHADIAMVDEGGVGAGVVDRLRQLRVPVYGVDFGSGSDASNLIERAIKYKNKRAQIWGGVKDWLPSGSIAKMAIPQVNGSFITLVDELTGPTYGLTDKEEIQLERKKDMRSRGVPSPNVADALACTFAFPSFTARAPSYFSADIPKVITYDPYALEHVYASLN